MYGVNLLHGTWDREYECLCMWMHVCIGVSKHGTIRIYKSFFCSDNFLEISFQQLQKGIDFNCLLCEECIYTHAYVYLYVYIYVYPYMYTHICIPT